MGKNREDVFVIIAVLKYIGYYAELPINLSKEIEDNIVAGMQETSVSQGVCIMHR